MLNTLTLKVMWVTTIRYTFLFKPWVFKKRRKKNLNPFFFSLSLFLTFSPAPVPIRRTEKAASSRHRPNHLTSKQLVSQVSTSLAISVTSIARAFIFKSLHMHLPSSQIYYNAHKLWKAFYLHSFPFFPSSFSTSWASVASKPPSYQSVQHLAPSHHSVFDIYLFTLICLSQKSEILRLRLCSRPWSCFLYRSRCRQRRLSPTTTTRHPKTLSHFTHAIWWIKAPVAWPALPLYMA